MNKVDEIAEELRHEPYHVLRMRHNCIGKSFRFKKECLSVGIRARVVICFGMIKAKPLGFWMTIPMIRACGEVDGKRIEVAHQLGEEGMWGMVDIDFKPIIGVWI